MTRHLSADVVIVGAGMAGLVAAITVLERGGSAIVIEKGTRYGGTMWLSSGFIWTFRDKGQIREEIPDGDPALQDLVVDHLPEGLSWLEEQGVLLEAERDFMWYGRGRPSDPKQMTPALAERLNVLGGEIRLLTPMLELVVNDGAVAGVRAGSLDEDLEIASGAVILATGGFQGNAELLQRYVTPYADRMYLRANPWSTGDGLLAATAIGAAATTNLNRFYGHAIAAPPTRFDEREFQEAGQRYGPLAVALNLDGHRFTDESAGTGEETLNASIGRQRDATAVLVVDADAAERSYFGGPTARSRVEWLRERDGPVLQSDSLEGLCDLMADWRLPPAEALETLTTFNAAVETEPGRLSPPRAETRHAITTPPFTAVLVRPGITFTAGGLHVDTQMQVLRRQASMTVLPLVSAPANEFIASAIPGLYAAGCDIGGVSSDRYMGGLSTALVSGRIAGASATATIGAHEVRSDAAAVATPDQ